MCDVSVTSLLTSDFMSSDILIKSRQQNCYFDSITIIIYIKRDRKSFLWFRWKCLLAKFCSSFYEFYCLLIWQFLKYFLFFLRYCELNARVIKKERNIPQFYYLVYPISSLFIFFTNQLTKEMEKPQDMPIKKEL